MVIINLGQVVWFVRRAIIVKITLQTNVLQEHIKVIQVLLLLVLPVPQVIISLPAVHQVVLRLHPLQRLIVAKPVLPVIMPIINREAVA